jgi:hypothetical protein
VPNEAERRRADFLGGVPVVMADGQTWYVPQPRVRFVPDPEHGARMVPSLPGVDDLAALTDPFGGGRLTIADHLRLGAAVLRLNYDLTDAELAGVLQMGFDGVRIKEQVIDAALGNAPKAGSGTES